MRFLCSWCLKGQFTITSKTHTSPYLLEVSPLQSDGRRRKACTDLHMKALLAILTCVTLQLIGCQTFSASYCIEKRNSKYPEYEFCHLALVSFETRVCAAAQSQVTGFQSEMRGIIFVENWSCSAYSIFLVTCPVVKRALMRVCL